MIHTHSTVHILAGLSGGKFVDCSLSKVPLSKALNHPTASLQSYWKSPDCVNITVLLEKDSI